MARQKTLTGQFVDVTATKATGPGNYRTVFGAIQGVLDFLTENRVPEHKIKGATFTSNAELCVLYHI